MKAHSTLGATRFLVGMSVLALLAIRTDLASGRDGVPAAGRQATSDARIHALIRQLGDAQYAARERAQEQLQSLGVVAFDAQFTRF